MPSRGQGREAWSMDKAAEAAGLGLTWLRCSIMSNSLWPPWTVAPKAPLSMGFFQQEYWSGLPFPSPADLPNPGIEPVSLMSSTTAGRFFTTSATWEALGPTRLTSRWRTWDSISRSVGSHWWALSMKPTVKGGHSGGVDGELEAVVHRSELARQGASCASQLHAQSWCWEQDFGHSGNVYTTAIGKHFKSRFSLIREPIAKYWPSGTTGSSGQGWWWEDELGTGTQQKWGGWTRLVALGMKKRRWVHVCLSAGERETDTEVSNISKHLPCPGWGCGRERTDRMSAKRISPTTAHPQLWRCGRSVPDDAGQQSWRYRAFRSLSKTLPRNCPVNVTFQMRVRAGQTLAASLLWHLQAKFTLLGEGASYEPVSFATSTIQFVGAGRERETRIV